MKKDNELTIVFTRLNNLTKTKTRKKWIDELTNYTLDLAYQDGEFANGILDDFLRGGFKGFYNMSDTELTKEVIEHLEYKYDMEEV